MVEPPPSIERTTISEPTRSDRPSRNGFPPPSRNRSLLELRTRVLAIVHSSCGESRPASCRPAPGRTRRAAGPLPAIPGSRSPAGDRCPGCLIDRPMLFGAGVQAGRPERAVPSRAWRWWWGGRWWWWGGAGLRRSRVFCRRRQGKGAESSTAPGVQRRRSNFVLAVLEAGICERRTRLAGPLFRPAGCAVARAGVRRPCRGRRPSRPRHEGRTAFPGPAGGGVRPAGGAGVRSGLPLTRSGGGWDDCACKPTSQPGTAWKQGEDDGTAPKRRAGRPARGAATDGALAGGGPSVLVRCRVARGADAPPCGALRDGFGCATPSRLSSRVTASTRSCDAEHAPRQPGLGVGDRPRQAHEAQPLACIRTRMASVPFVRGRRTAVGAWP